LTPPPVEVEVSGSPVLVGLGPVVEAGPVAASPEQPQALRVIARVPVRIRCRSR
jgi:hypothetical protein